MSEMILRIRRWWWRQRVSWNKRTRPTRWYVPWWFCYWLERRGYCWFDVVMWRQFGGDSWRWWECLMWKSTCGAPSGPDKDATCYCGYWDRVSDRAGPPEGDAA